MQGNRLTQTGWARVRARLFHTYFLFSRPMTLGVRGVILKPGTREVFLIRHTYVPGWQLPGGGVETGETMEYALEREVREEANIGFTGAPRLVSIHFNPAASRRDHVAIYLISDFEQTTVKEPDHEIAEARFFSVDALPEDTTPGTARRIAEIIHGQPPSPLW